MPTKNIVPREQGEGQLGTASKGWNKAFFMDRTTSSASTGASIVLAADDGALIPQGHRLGVIEFQGAEDTSSTMQTGARIEAVVADDWSATQNNTDLDFYTTDGNAVQSKILRLGNDKLATFEGAVKAVNDSATARNYRTIWVDAASMVPQVTNGAQSGTAESADTYDVMNDYYAFDASTIEYVQFRLVMPEQWDGGTVKARFYWRPKSSTTTTHSVLWSIAAKAHADGGIVEGAWGVEQTALDDVIATSSPKKVHITDATSAITIANSPSGTANELCYFRVRRTASNVNDDLNEDALLYGVLLQYRETATAEVAW